MKPNGCAAAILLALVSVHSFAQQAAPPAMRDDRGAMMMPSADEHWLGAFNPRRSARDNADRLGVPWYNKHGL